MLLSQLQVLTHIGQINGMILPSFPDNTYVGLTFDEYSRNISLEVCATCMMWML